MNAKKAKTLRKILRTNGTDPAERSYTADPAGTITLKKNCGRHMYRDAKRMAAR